MWHIRYFFFIFCPAITWTWETSLEDAHTLVQNWHFVAAKFLQKYPWCYTIHFQFHLFENWTISALVSSRLAQRSPTNSLLPSGKAMVLLSDPRCFGPLGKFQHNVKISIKTVFPFLDYVDMLKGSEIHNIFIDNVFIFTVPACMYFFVMPLWHLKFNLISPKINKKIKNDFKHEKFKNNCC